MWVDWAHYLGRVTHLGVFSRPLSKTRKWQLCQKLACLNLGDSSFTAGVYRPTSRCCSSGPTVEHDLFMVPTVMHTAQVSRDTRVPYRGESWTAESVWVGERRGAHWCGRCSCTCMLIKTRWWWVGEEPDLDPNYLTWYLWKNFLKKLIFKKFSRRHKKKWTQNYPACKEQDFSFLISQPKLMLWVSMRRSFWAPKHMLKLTGKKIFTSLGWNFLFI